MCMKDKCDNLLKPLYFCRDFSQNINFLRKQPKEEVNRTILQVGFQPFSEIPHHFLRKEVGISSPETDMNFPLKVHFLQ